MITKSNYMNFITCPKAFWLGQNAPELGDDSKADPNLARQGILVGETARSYFGTFQRVSLSSLDTMAMHTQELLNDPMVSNITEASFIHADCFCALDILHKNADGSMEIYEVKAVTEPKAEHREDLAFQYYVAKNAGLKISKASLLYLNKAYVRCDEVNLQELFIIEDLSEFVQQQQKIVEQNLAALRKQLNAEAPHVPIDTHCHKPNDCIFWAYCTRDIPSPNVFDVRGGTFKSKKHEWFKRGIVSFDDLDRNASRWQIKLSEKALRQVRCEIGTQSEHIHLPKIRQFLTNFTYPLYFLDFETINQAVPPFDGTSPYQQIPFQYSLHILDSCDATASHREYLAEPEQNWLPELVAKMCHDIPDNVCVVAYNMSFEKSCLRLLAKLHPTFASQLMAIHDNMCDLMIPFKDQLYYTKAMSGSYSIKYVLPALFPDDPSLNYANLVDVHNGTEAMASFAAIADMQAEQREILRQNLLKYCELDTFAMVRIWQKLNQEVQEYND